MLFNQKTIGADYKLVAEEFDIANMQGLPINQRLTASAVVIGIGIGSLPKTFNLLFTNPTAGFAQIMTWYTISSIGVTNRPSGN